jgi:hypothetical protein
MGEVRPIPTLGGVFRDVRGQARALRVSWHGEDGLVVLSLWDGPRCTGTVRLDERDVPALLEALSAGLRPAEPLSPAPPPLAPAPAPQPTDPGTQPPAPPRPDEGTAADVISNG